MKHTYAWGAIIAVLALFAGFYWVYSQRLNQEGYVVPSVFQPHQATSPNTMPTNTPNSNRPPVTSTGSSGSTNSDVRPKISTLTPGAGKASTLVIIKGTNFDQKNNIILFGPSFGRHHLDGSPDNQIAVMTSADGKTLSFQVPVSGPSGQLCDQQNQCVAVAAIHLTPGVYSVSVVNKNGVSNQLPFTITK